MKRRLSLCVFGFLLVVSLVSMGAVLSVEEIAPGVRSVRERQNRMARWNEYQYFPPSSFYLFKLNLQGEPSPFFFRFSGNGLGVQDVSAGLVWNYKDSLISKGSYEKYPHYFSFAESTQRNIHAWNWTILPLNPAHLTVYLSEEDKMGWNAFREEVGQKNRIRGISGQAVLGSLALLADASRIHFFHPSLGYDLSSFSMTAQSRWKGSYYFSSSLLTRGLESRDDVSNPGDVSITDWSSGVSFNPGKDFSLLATYSTRRHKSDSPTGLTLNGERLDLSADYTWKMDSSSSHTFQADAFWDTTDLGGTEIQQQRTREYGVTYRAKFKKFSLKTSYRRTLRDALQILNTQLMNTEELPLKKSRGDISFSYAPTGSLSFTYFFVDEIGNYDLVSPYGVQGQEWTLHNFTASCAVRENLVLTATYLFSQWDVDGFLKELGPAGEFPAPYDIVQNQESTLLGVDWGLDDKTHASISYLFGRTKVGNFFESNKIREDNWDVSVSREFLPDFTVNLSAIYNFYEDKLDATFGDARYVEFQIRKNF